MDIKGDWKKRAVCGLMVLAMALSLLPTSILAADTRSVTDNAIKNGSFEQPAFDDKPSPISIRNSLGAYKLGSILAVPTRSELDLLML